MRRPSPPTGMDPRAVCDPVCVLLGCVRLASFSVLHLTAAKELRNAAIGHLVARHSSGAAHTSGGLPSSPSVQVSFFLCVRRQRFPGVDCAVFPLYPARTVVQQMVLGSRVF